MAITEDILKPSTKAPVASTKKPIAPELPNVPRWTDADFQVTQEDMAAATQQAPAGLPSNFMQRLGLEKKLGLYDITQTSFVPYAQNAEAKKKAATEYRLASSGSTKGLNPAFAGAVAAANAAMKAAGLGTFKVNDGFRTFDEQAALYQKWLRGEGNLAAKPTGKSSHEIGNAIDINWSQLNARQRKWLEQNLPKYGIQPPSWNFHYNVEPWHWQWYGEGGY